MKKRGNVSTNAACGHPSPRQQPHPHTMTRTVTCTAPPRSRSGPRPNWRRSTVHHVTELLPRSGCAEFMCYVLRGTRSAVGGGAGVSPAVQRLMDLFITSAVSCLLNMNFLCLTSTRWLCRNKSLSFCLLLLLSAFLSLFTKWVGSLNKYRHDMKSPGSKTTEQVK